MRERQRGPPTASLRAQEAASKFLNKVREKAAKKPRDPLEPKAQNPKTEHARAPDGRFAGVRRNVEDVPRLPPPRLGEMEEREEFLRFPKTQWKTLRTTDESVKWRLAASGNRLGGARVTPTEAWGTRLQAPPRR